VSRPSFPAEESSLRDASSGPIALLLEAYAVAPLVCEAASRMDFTMLW
jgi:hypothetical protein